MALKICKECGAEVSSKGICPKCGKDQRNFFKKHKVITFLLVVVVLGGIIGVSGNGKSKTNPTQTSTTVEQTQEKFTLQDGHQGTTDKYGMSYTIEGTIKNNTDKQYSYVQVTFNLYDSDGAQIGTALANINNLEANGVWKFKASGSFGNGKTVASYKLMEITGW